MSLVNFKVFLECTVKLHGYFGGDSINFRVQSSFYSWAKMLGGSNCGIVYKTVMTYQFYANVEQTTRALILSLQENKARLCLTKGNLLRI